ncbi:Protein of unknown function, partial [Gryllus bimaculatus]
QEVVMNGSETIVDDELEKVEKSAKLQAAAGESGANTPAVNENCTKIDEQNKDAAEKDADVPSKKDKEDKKEKEKKEKDKDKKDKVKRKWSFRSLGMSRKDKSKPREETSKNGDVTKEEAEIEEGAEKKPEVADDAAPAVIAEEKVTEASNAESISPAEQTPGSTDPSTALLTPASTLQVTPESAEVKPTVPEDVTEPASPAEDQPAASPSTPAPAPSQSLTLASDFTAPTPAAALEQPAEAETEVPQAEEFYLSPCYKRCIKCFTALFYI